MMKALPYIFLAAAAIAEGLAVYLRWPKKKKLLIQPDFSKEGGMRTEEVIQKMKIFWVWIAWRIGLPANEPVKCQCALCEKWSNMIKGNFRSIPGVKGLICKFCDHPLCL